MGDLSGWFFAALMVGGWLAAIWLMGSKRRRLGRVFSEAGKQLGLSSDGSRLQGQVHEFDVVVELTGSAFQSRSQYEDLRIGAWTPRFPAPEVVALVRSRLGLDAPLIPGARPVVAKREGMSIVIPGIPGTASDLLSHIQVVVSAAQKVLAAPVPEYLFENLAPDQKPEVRLESLRALATHYRKTEEAAWGLHRCLTDSDAEVRYLAAQETTDTALADFVVDPRVPPDLRMSALMKLEARIPYERLSPVLGKVLQLQDEGARTRALFQIASHSDKAHLEAIASLATQAGATLSENVARTLQRLECRSEPAWIELLGSVSDAARLVAISELRSFGSVRAVEPLLALVERGQNKNAAHDAVRAIQSRIAGAEAGSVSLVEGAADGGVSLMPEREKS